MFYKRKSFKYESEVRIVAWTNEKNETLGAEVNDLPGIYIDVDLTKLIEAVWIAPNSPHWYLNSVKTFLQANGLGHVIVERSQLDSPPEYLQGMKRYQLGNKYRV
jgi:uncharacterized protein YndB with AHSA1/START domain